MRLFEPGIHLFRIRRVRRRVHYGCPALRCGSGEAAGPQVAHWRQFVDDIDVVNTPRRSVADSEEKDKANAAAANRRAADVQQLLAASLSLSCDVVAFIGPFPADFKAHSLFSLPVIC
jgi:hypothetical protein